MQLKEVNRLRGTLLIVMQSSLITEEANKNIISAQQRALQTQSYQFQDLETFRM